VTQLTTRTDNMAERVLEVLVSGNLSVLSPAERVDYYERVCESLQLNALTKPFEFITLNNKLVLYALKSATDQLRQIHGVSISEPRIQHEGDLYIVTVTAVDQSGRTDSDMGVVAIVGLKGENLANAMLKAITKAKRRVTLSICGLGMLDETEISDIPESAKRPPVQMPQPRQVESRREPEPPFGMDTETGEIVDKPSPPTMWEVFWGKTNALGFSEAQVRSFVGVDEETFDALERDDLLLLLTNLKGAAQPALA